MKRALTFVILISMLLHCASRLGILSYLYRERHRISFEIGLIAEIPIAVCSSHYQFSKELKIHDTESSEKLPVSHRQAHEILLFFKKPGLEFGRTFFASEIHYTLYLEIPVLQPLSSIFHPPCVSVVSHC